MRTSVQLSFHHSQNLLRERTNRLLGRLFGPLCGIDQMVGLANRAMTEPRIFVLSAELAGVHLLLGRPQPAPNAYHIGGAGLCLEEAMIKTLAETIERYCQMLAYASGQHATRFCSYRSLIEDGSAVVAPEQLTFFSTEQLNQPEFPFARFDNDMALDWVEARSLLRDDKIWLPSQLAFVGYNVKQTEKRLSSGVTTGTAAHTDCRLAARSAILELVQLDTAMGFWFSGQVAPEIVLNGRTSVISDLIARHFHPAAPKPRFFWLRNPDLPAFTIACVTGSSGDAVPASAVGLGCDLKLNEAMYKAMLEAVAVSYLAKIVAFQESISPDPQPADTGLFDLDANVGFYARPENLGKIHAKFGGLRAAVEASEMPGDFEGSVNDELAHLADAFARSGKELLFLDITTDDAAALGFRVLRVWSPDLLSLSLPRFPPAAHQRFNAYGGFQDASPHPYP